MVTFRGAERSSAPLLLFVLSALVAFAAPAPLAIDYPLDGSLFPSDITAPTFLWSDSSAAASWRIDIEFADGSPALHATSSARRWTPDTALWTSIKNHSLTRPARLTVANAAGARAQIGIRTSPDPVGAPVFYREVPLMPSEVEPGVIKPLAPKAVPLITWKLRYLDEPASRTVLKGLYSCTNCHSFSHDGKTLGMDLDGPENDKGTYAIAPVSPRMTIRNQDVITWNSFAEKPPGAATIGFMSQISPDGRYAVTTLNEQVYVSNFKDFRFLQVFYPTRGILAWLDRATAEIKALPGADDPHFVHTGAVWSPDGSYLVFARAQARDAYPPGRPLAAYANDPNELPIQYDLYRIPFNGGRGGTPERIAGASANGMSNSFPKVSPDGRWIVYVQARNGLLMRPDSRLFIVPATGGQARPLRSNTPLMNSWHSFSPGGRWMVFSSKSRSPYTQMFLTHIDEDGNDSPPILIENATDPERAVNLPEFAAIPRDGLLAIDVPAAEFYRLFDHAQELETQGRLAEALAEWRRALALDPSSAKAHTNLGIALWKSGATADSLAEFRAAVKLKPNYAEAHNNLGVGLMQTGRIEEAIGHFQIYLSLIPASIEVNANLAEALYQTGKTKEALDAARRALALAIRQQNQPLADQLKQRIALYDASPRP